MSEKETVLDAVNAALGDDMAAGGSDDELDTPAPETPDSEGDLGSGDPDDAAGESETPEGAEGEAEETDAEAEARGAERDPATGKFVKKGEEKPEVEKAAKVEPPKKDPINDPIPANLKKEATERIRSVIAIAKEKTAELEKVTTDFNYLIKGVEATGTSPEQYGETLSWLALFNSPDPKNQEKALELVETVAERLATLLGKERTVGDPLSAHPDLKDAVTKGQITAQYAKEIARTRNGQAFRTEINTTATQAEQQRQAAATELETARNGLSALEQTLQGTDPEYATKKSILVQALKPVFAAIPPSQWVGKFQEAYKNLKLTGAPARKAPTTQNQPLRAGKQPAGGQTKQPSSMLEAISGALSGMNGK